MKKIIISKPFVLFSYAVLCIFLTSCLGGGLDLWGKKPKCLGKSSHGYYASKSYKCQNKEFEIIDDEYKCVQGGCEWFSGGSQGCSWIETNLKTIVKDKHSDFYYAQDYNPIYYNDGTSQIKLYPLCCDEYDNAYVCGNPKTVDIKDDDVVTPSTPTDPFPIFPPNTKGNINTQTETIYNPNLGICSNSTNYRLEEEQVYDKSYWAALNNCDQLGYVDTQAPEGDIRNEMMAKHLLSFGLPYWVEGKFAVVVLDNDYVGTTIGDLESHSMVMGSKILDQQEKLPLVVKDGDKSILGLVEVPVIFSEDKYITKPYEEQSKVISYKSAVFKQKSDGTFERISAFNQFSLANTYSYSDETFQRRELNLLCFKNSAEAAGTGTFKSDIRSYTYGKDRTFYRSLQGSFVEQVGCRINLAPKSERGHLLENNILPNFLVDAEGNIVLYAEDFVFNNRNEIDITGLIQKHKSFATGFKKEVITKWYTRLLTYVRFGIVEGWPPTMGSMHDDFSYSNPLVPLSAIYNNIMSVLVINGYVIKNRPDADAPASINDLATNTTLNNQLKAAFASYGAPQYAGETLCGTIPENTAECNGSASAIENYVIDNYTPIAVVYGAHLKTIGQDFNGMTIVTALHEMAHAWYTNGVTDCSKGTILDQHAAYSIGKHSSYDLIRYNPHTHQTVASNTFYHNQLMFMKFSVGLAYRMRNVLSCSYNKTKIK